MVGDVGSTDDGAPALIADAIEGLYRVFAGHRLGPHVEGCPHCVSDRDHGLIYARPLRLLTADDLDLYARKAMTTWGNENDFRHFLPRILELMVSSEPDWLVDTEVVLGKLAYANWTAWPKLEQAALRSFLRLRWTVGLTQDVSEFDADTWLCGVTRAGDDVTAYIDAWRRLGALNTLGHIAAFLAMNPDLLSQGKLGNAFWNPADPQTATCAQTIRTWLTAYMDDPDFQTQLAARYQS